MMRPAVNILALVLFAIRTVVYVPMYLALFPQQQQRRRFKKILENTARFGDVPKDTRHPNCRCIEMSLYHLRVTFSAKHNLDN